MLTGELLHDAFNTTQPPYVPKLSWSDLSEPAQAKYEGMAHYLNVQMREGLAAWVDLHTAPSYTDKDVKHFARGQAEEIGV